MLGYKKLKIKKLKIKNLQNRKNKNKLVNHVEIKKNQTIKK